MTLTRRRHGAAPAPAGIGDSRRPAPTASPRCRARSPSPPTCRPTGCCGAPRCARRIRTPASSRIDPSRGVADPRRARPSSPPTTCPASHLRPDRQDQPVFAADVVRYVGEPVAAVAADHPETCRRALAAIVVEYEVLEPLIDPEGRSTARTRRSTPTATSCATSASCSGDPDATGPTSWSRAPTRSACRTRRSSASRRRWPSPTPAAAASSCYIATQWLHEDRKQIAACLGLPEEKVRLMLGGVGGAFGAREDISLQVHSLPARPAHRSAGEDAVRPGGELPRPRAPPSGDDLDAPPRHRRRPHRQDRGPVRVRRRRLRVHVVGRAAQRHHPRPGPVRVRERRRRRLGGAHQQPAVRRDARLRRRAGVLRPRGPDGQAGRGVRPRPGRDPAAQRHAHRRPADHRPGRRERGAGRALHPRDGRAAAARRAGRRPRRRSPCACPGGAGRTADAGHVRRGVGFGVAIKNLMYSEGFDDYSTARCRLADGVATLKFATAEVGQGFVTIAQQIARTRARRRRRRARADRHPRSARPAPRRRRARRGCAGGAVDAACRAVRERLFEHVGAAARHRAAAAGRSTAPTSSTRWATCGCPWPRPRPALRFDETVEYHHRPTEDLDENGQGNCHTAFAFVAHRAVVDVDPELGLVKVVQVATAQDVGRALNPLSVIGQIEGGIAQGLGLAVMEEIVIRSTAASATPASPTTCCRRASTCPTSWPP